MIYVLQNKHSNYMKKVILALMLLVSYTAEAQQKIGLIYDENVQKRKVTPFIAIKVSNAIDLYITQSNSNEVAVSANSVDIRNQIITEVVGGTLIIRMGENDSWYNWKKWRDYKAKAYVSVKELNALTASGACNIKLVDKVETPKLKIKLSGATDFKGDLEVGYLSMSLSGASDCKADVKATTMALDISGASSVELKGSSDDLSVEVSGASDANLFNLNVKGAIVEASGASSAKLTVSQLLKVQASGASNVEYKGEASLKESSSGASSVKRRN